MQPWKTWGLGCRPIWSLSIFVTVIFLWVRVGYIQSLSKFSLIALAPCPQGKLGMGKLSCWEMGMGMDAERE